VSAVMPVPLNGDAGPTGHEPLLDVRDLSVEFATPRGWLPVLDRVCLALHRGEITAVVGESGSGKSVTALAVTGLLPPRVARTTSGSIRLGGTDLLRLRPRELARIQGRRLAMVFQEPITSLNPAFTVGDQVGESLRHHLGYSRREATRRAVELLDEVGIPHATRRVRAYPHEFSGGMRQRVMLAMALACGPDVLIADEPTTALDVTIQAQIVELIARLSRQHDMAVMFITHDFGVVAELADRVAVMYAGQVVESGDVHQIFAAPTHPYTQALLDVAGSLDDDGDGDIAWIEGSPPSLHALPRGCRFAGRCGFADERCTTTSPPLVALGTGRWSRCLRRDELHLPGRP